MPFCRRFERLFCGQHRHSMHKQLPTDCNYSLRFIEMIIRLHFSQLVLQFHISFFDVSLGCFDRNVKWKKHNGILPFVIARCKFTTLPFVQLHSEIRMVFQQKQLKFLRIIQNASLASTFQRVDTNNSDLSLEEWPFFAVWNTHTHSLSDFLLFIGVISYTRVIFYDFFYQTNEFQEGNWKFFIDFNFFA